MEEEICRGLSRDKQKILYLLSHLWAQYPLMSFGQVVGCMAGKPEEIMLVFDNKTKDAYTRVIEPSVWSMADEKLLMILEGLLHGQGDF